MMKWSLLDASNSSSCWIPVVLPDEVDEMRVLGIGIIVVANNFIGIGCCCMIRSS